MRPLTIEMKGFSAFRDPTTVDLADVELFALVGQTGSGKSTIIDAITFALFGSVARYDDNRAVAPVVNQTSNEARVALTFEVNGQRYVAVRVVRRTAKGATTKEARLERGAEVLAADARSMNKAVEELLGLDVDQFNRTVVLPQGRFADFLHDDPANRQATLRQLLGLDVYSRVGQAARQLATRRHDEAELLGAQLAADAALLTDERYEALSARLPAIASARDVLAEATATIDSLAEARAAAAAAATTAQQHLGLLALVQPPTHVDELDATLAAATGARAAAQEQLAAARTCRQATREAVAAGPDRVAVSTLLQRHDDLLAQRQEVVECATTVDGLSGELTTATTRADEVRATQQQLDAAVGAQQSSAEAARGRSAELPSVAQLDVWLQLHATHASNQARHESTGAEAAEAARLAGEARDAATEAAAAADALEATVDALRDDVGIAAHAGRLAVGEPCPLCLQEVRHLPEHHAHEALDAAEARLRDAAAVRMQTRTAHEQLAAAAHRSQAEHESAIRDLERSTASLIGVASKEALAAQRREAEQLAAEVESAVAAAKSAMAAAAQHRDRPASREALQRESDLQSQLAGAQGEQAGAARRLSELEAALSGQPSRDECERLDAQARELAAAADAAEADEREREHEHDRATTAMEQARAQVGTARQQLGRVRDQVAVLGAPEVAGEHLAADWATLVAWAGNTRQGLVAASDAADAEADRCDQAIESTSAEARAEIGRRLGEDVGAHPIRTLGELLAARESSARAELTTFERERAKHAEQQSRIDGLREQEQVARKLGHLLRSDGFEGWLMQSALERLAGRATERLFELSGGQYSLVLQDRAFAVRDHNNADEVRGARTLSGGETFLASLSLALALSAATAELAPEGAPEIESIFLDEGFGTLDPQTLDTVASAIEELGASGRMVGIVTHIRELADRMPVRLEVTKTGGSSSVQRVEV